MEVIIKRTPAEGCRLAARLVTSLIQRKPNAVLGLSAGKTPLPLYAELIRLHREEGLDFCRVTTFNLDEYLGLGPNDPRSYHFYMQENLFKHINIPAGQIHIPDGLAQDVPRSCKEYEEAILVAGGIDLQILGIGRDGHIGFNEPASSLSSRTRIKTLTQETIHANNRSFPSRNKMPLHVITMGVGTIREAGCCILLAFGEAKARAVFKMVEGPITALMPASILQLHPHTIAIFDKAASRRLSLTPYYQHAYKNKPSWQRYE